MNKIADLFKNPQKYRKFWVAVAGAGVYFLTQVLGADSPYLAAIIQVLIAAGVYQIKNERS